MIIRKNEERKEKHNRLLDVTNAVELNENEYDRDEMFGFEDTSAISLPKKGRKYQKHTPKGSIIGI